MAVIRLAGFLGESRAQHPTLVPDGMGVASRNQKPGRGDLRAWMQPLTVATVPAGRRSIYRLGRDVASDSLYWLSWTSSPVHAVRGFDPADTTERTYFSGDGAPKVTDNTSLDGTDPQDNPAATRPMGLPAPTGAPSVSTVAGGTSTELQTVYYVYTYVNDWGWESAPSPVSASNTRKLDASATVSGFTAAPAGNYNINRRRIYRTATGSSGATDFFFLREIAIGTSSITDANEVLGELLPTTGWLPAPGVPIGGASGGSEGNLSHLTAMWNGMLAGISANRVRLCEPYLAYAWPDDYDIVPPDGKPVGLGVFGQRLLVLTTGRPLLLQGSTPDSMDQTPLEIPQGCVSARSVVSMGAGVAWASEDGLCWFGTDGARILTDGLMTRKDWQVLVPSSIVGRLYEGMYFGSYSTDGGVTRQGFMLSPGAKSGIYFLDSGYEGLHFDELMDQLYVLDGTSVRKWDAGATSLTYRFRSKAFRAPRPVNFACAEVLADAYPVTFRVWGDGVLRHTQTVTGSGVFRLPAGFMALDWQFEIEGTGAVQSAAIATSVGELAAVG